MTEETDPTSGPYSGGFASFTASVRSEQDILGEDEQQGIINVTLSLDGETAETVLTVEQARDMIDALTRAAAIAEDMASGTETSFG